jgi:hypothetical protein
MIVLKVLICFLTIFVFSEGKPTKDNEKNCELKFRFAKICKIFDFDSSSAIENGCHPSQLKNCRILKTKKNEAKCPYYECPVSTQ